MGDPSGLILVKRDGSDVYALNVFNAADAEVGRGCEGEGAGVGRGREGDEGVDVLEAK